jgi:hypothetical protein
LGDFSGGGGCGIQVEVSEDDGAAFAGQPSGDGQPDALGWRR